MQKFQKIGELNWFKSFNKAGKHSVKPDEFYRIVEKMSPAPRIDIFARQKRRDWDVFGDEIPTECQNTLLEGVSPPTTEVMGIRNTYIL